MTAPVVKPRDAATDSIGGVRSRIEIDARGQNQDFRAQGPTRGGVSMTADMIHGQQVDPGWHDFSISAA